MAEGGLLSLDDLAVDVCGRCGTSGCEVKCVQCKMQFHKRCVSKVSEEGVCDECAADSASGIGQQQSLNKTITGINQLGHRVSFFPEDFQANSTSAVPTQKYEELQKKYEELERVARRLTCVPGQFPTPAKTQSVAGDTPNQTGHNQSNSRNESGLAPRESWRDQVARLNETFDTTSTQSLTKEQRDMRKTLKTKLPQFNGEARQWVDFITSYADTTESCGFSDSENK